MLKVVPDANVVVSAFLSPGSTAERALRRMQLEACVVVSPAMATEWDAVLSRPRFVQAARRVAPRVFLADLLASVIIVKPLASVRDCRDPKDDKVLECALAAGADLIVSGDKDLLVLHPWRSIPVLSPAAYLAS